MMKLSIITINYNNCEGLRKTIESVVNQTWKEFEWIIVDGGSTDGSKELIEETACRLEGQGWNTRNFSLLGFTADDWKDGNYPSLEPRDAYTHTLLWTSEKDKGIYNAMNKGIVMAQGEYCLFLNSGDWLYDETVLYSMAKHLINTVDIIIGRVYNEKTGASRVYPKYYSLHHLYYYSYPHQGCFINRALFYEYGLYSENYKIISDWDFFVETIIHGNVHIKLLNNIIARLQDGGLSANKGNLDAEGNILRKKRFSNQLLEDLQRSESLSEVLNASWFTRKAYSFLYRIAIFIR